MGKNMAKNKEREHENEEREHEDNGLCCLCGEELDDPYGHNALPVADGRCCVVCNDTEVIPARLLAMMGKRR